MTITEQLHEIIELLGGSDTADNLITSKLDSIIALKGGTSTENNLITSKLRYIAELLNGSTESSLYTDMIADIIEELGGECDSRLVSEQLDAIIELLDNLLDYDKYVAGSGSTFDNGTIVHDTGSSNHDYSKIYVETSKNWSYVDELAQFDSTGNKTVQLTIDSTIDMFRIGLFGDSGHASVYFYINYIEDGNYIISFNIKELSLNHAVITGLAVIKG